MDDEKEGSGQDGAESGVRGESSHLLFLKTSNMDGQTIQTFVDGVKMELNATHQVIPLCGSLTSSFSLKTRWTTKEEEIGQDGAECRSLWGERSSFTFTFFFYNKPKMEEGIGQDEVECNLPELFLCIFGFIVLFSQNKMEGKEGEKMELNTFYVLFIWK